MRRRISFKIYKEPVYEEAKKASSYKARKLQEEGKSYEHVRITDAAEEMLNRFWKEVKEGVETLLSDYLVCVKMVEKPEAEEPEEADEDEGWEQDGNGTWHRRPGREEADEDAPETKAKAHVEYLIETAGNYDERRNGSVEQGLFLFSVYHVLEQWMALINADLAAEYTKLKEGVETAILGNLHHRMRPKRRAMPPLYEVSEEMLIDEEDEEEEYQGV